MTAVSLQVWRTELSIDVRADLDRRALGNLLAQQALHLDKAASRFRADSEVAGLTRRAGDWVPVSPLLLSLVHVAIQVAAATDGLVHPGLGGVISHAGYDTWAGQVTTVLGDEAVLPWQAIEVDATGAIRIPRGMVLDLGAVAKAWLADQLATVLHEATGAAVLANMGGDIRCISTDTPWLIRLDPELPGASPLDVPLRNAGIATSGRSRRSWSGGHHIIDPRTGASAATPWWSASVIAADAVGANAASTAAMVLGVAAPPWLARQGLTARLVTEQGSATTIGPWAGQERAA